MQYSMCKTVCMHLFHCPSVWWLEKQFSPWLQPCWLSGPSHGPRSVPGVRTTGRCFHVLSVGKLANPSPTRFGHGVLGPDPGSAGQQCGATMLEPLHHCCEVLCSCHFDGTSDHFLFTCLSIFFPYRSKCWLEQPVTVLYCTIWVCFITGIIWLECQSSNPFAPTPSNSHWLPSFWGSMSVRVSQVTQILVATPGIFSTTCFTIVKPQILHLETEVKGGYRL